MNTKGLNEAHFLSLLRKTLSRTTSDAQLATTIYAEVEREVRLIKDLESFEKFCEKGGLPNLAPETVAELQSELSAKFGEGNVTLTSTRKPVQFVSPSFTWQAILLMGLGRGITAFRKVRRYLVSQLLRTIRDQSRNQFSITRFAWLYLGRLVGEFLHRFRRDLARQLDAPEWWSPHISLKRSRGKYLPSSKIWHFYNMLTMSNLGYKKTR
jgi:hypothetical protein